MAISFPNHSRSYDTTRRAVRFWGYDSAMETSFFVSEEALKRIQPDMRFDEAGLLRAFDLNRVLILPRRKCIGEVTKALTICCVMTFKALARAAGIYCHSSATPQSERPTINR